MFVFILQDVVFSNRNVMIVVLFDSSFFIYFKGVCFLNSTEVWDEITDLDLTASFSWLLQAMHSFSFKKRAQFRH